MQDLRKSFPGQEKNEAVFVFARPFILAFVPTMLIFVFILALASVVQYGIAVGSIVIGQDALAAAAVVGLGLFELFVIIVFFIALFDFYFDIIIVTDRRLVDIDQEQLFYRSISELALEDVEDVRSVVKGLFPTVFNYGTVNVQTAGARENFVVSNIRFPREVAALILDLSGQAKQSVLVEERSPETEVLAVINDKPLRTFEELRAAGAVVPQDMRRFRRSKAMLSDAVE